MGQRESQDRTVLVIVLVVAVVLVAAWIFGGSQPAGEPMRSPASHTIAVYGFSVMEEVMTEEILPAFQEHWREQTGQGMTFESVFAGSEQLSEEILAGAMADVAILSNEQQAIWLRINNWIETDWHAFPHEGIISCSPLVIAVRPGNPLGIRDWRDLAQPGVRIVHPDPRTSGGAQWALLAEYGSALLADSNHDKQVAHGQLQDIWANVVVAPASSREALKQFVFGTGDALVAYEQSALLALARGADLEVIIPPQTVMSEHVAVLVDRNVKSWEQEVVQAFREFLLSKTAQEAFTDYYFRAVTDEALNQAVPEFRVIDRPFTVEDLGGWGRAYPEIVRGVWEEQILEGAD